MLNNNSNNNNINNSSNSPKQQKTVQIPLLQDNQGNQKQADLPFLKLFHFCDKSDRIIIFIATLFALGNGISIVFYAYPLKQLINSISQTKQQIVSSTLHSVYGFLMNSVLVFVSCWFMTAAWTITAQRQMNKARKQYLRSLLNKDIKWHQMHSPSLVCSKMYNQINKVQQSIVTNMTALLNKISMGVCGIGVALYIGYEMAIIMILFLPFMMASGYFRGTLLKKKQMYLQEQKVKVDADVMEVFDNIKAVKIMGGEQYQLKRYISQINKQFMKNWNFGWKGAIAFTFFFFCIIMNYALGFSSGSYLVSNKIINSNTGKVYNVSDVITIFFTLYISNLNLSGLPDCLASFSVAKYAMKEILKVIQQKVEMKEGDIQEQQIRNIQRIVFENVKFNYGNVEDNESQLFQNFNLSIEKGVTALTGQSGCGKSTIISLLMRFYDVQKGSISFQSKISNSKLKKYKIQQLTYRALRKTIGYVGQQPVLIGKTLRQVLSAQNIPDKQIFQVLSMTKCRQFVQNIGLHSQFKCVSGGEKQRLAIARALLKKPKILVLDESTSALDRKTQAEVLQNIMKIKEIQFIVMVTHRNQTFKFADKIVKINKSRIQFEGNYFQAEKMGIVKNLDLVAKTISEADNEQFMKNQKQQQNKIRQIMSNIEQKQSLKQQSQQNIINNSQQNKLKLKWSYIPKLMRVNKNKQWLYIVGIIGAIYFGCIFPAFSYLISQMITVLQNIQKSTPETLPKFQQQSAFLSRTLLLISFGSLVFTTLRWVCFQYLNQNIGRNVKINAFSQLITRKYQRIQQQNPHKYAIIITKNCQDLKPLCGNYMPTIIQNTITLILGLCIAFAYSWQITLVALLIMPLIVLSSKMMMSFNHGMQSNTDQLHKNNHELVVNSVINIKTVRSCSLQHKILSKYNIQLDNALEHSTKYANLGGILFGIGQTLISCTFAVIFLIGAKLIQSGYMEVGDLYVSIFGVMFAAVQAGGNLYFLGQMPVVVIGAGVYFNQIYRDNEYERRRRRVDQLQQQHIQQHNNNIGSTGGCSLKISNVTFSYKNRPQPIFTNLNLYIKQGERVGIVGSSGSGKSTLAALVVGLYTPTHGTITIHTHDGNTNNMDDIHGCVGMVMQQPILFNRSIYQNIKYNTNATFQQVKAAAILTNSYQFINNHTHTDTDTHDGYIEDEYVEDGFKRVVGPKGCKLSGGQKQRIAISRAIVRHPQLLILDQATSALDNTNEHIVQHTIDTLGHINMDNGIHNNKVTQMIIAHRLSTIQKCDRIVVMERGNIAEMGTYQQLIQLGGYFSNMVNNTKQQ